MPPDAPSAGVQILVLGWTASASAFGLGVTFGGAVPVSYQGRPSAGSVVLDFAFEGRTERVVWMQSDWGEHHEIFGFGYRVLNAPELKPREVRVEITNRRSA